ncbi:BgTH12-07619 [Blumeria graminis f. sp. triticale]|nr:BgTH12-07619 [Blumeria graminis f. sp. triticale]
MSSQFEKGHQIPISYQSTPGLQHEMVGQDAINDHLPAANGGSQPYLPSGKLRGKKALITGGDSGIGRAIAILYAMEGAESTIVYLPEEDQDAQETTRLVESRGGKLHLIQADLQGQKACADVVTKAKDLMGSINILVLNHGYQMMKEDISELNEEQWVKTFNINVHPFFFLSKYALGSMSSGDSILTCASVNHYVGRPDLLDYSATKGAIIAFTRALSNQLIEKGIRVNAVCPGPIWTPLIPATMNEKAQKDFTSPMGRPGQPSEVATCFVFLASQDSSFISGQCLHPNGGVIVGS